MATFSNFGHVRSDPETVIKAIQERGRTQRDPVEFTRDGNRLSSNVRHPLAGLFAKVEIEVTGEHGGSRVSLVGKVAPPWWFAKARLARETTAWLNQILEGLEPQGPSGPGD